MHKNPYKLKKKFLTAGNQVGIITEVEYHDKQLKS